jgi:hypothetical protein
LTKHDRYDAIDLRQIMNTLLRTAILLLTVTFVSVAAEPKNSKLTPEKLALLTATDGVPKYSTCKVTIAGLASTPATKPAIGFPNPEPTRKNEPASIQLKPDGKPVVLEWIREFRFPTDFESAKTVAKDVPAAITPVTPTAFETVNTGWTIKLAARQQGRLLAITGSADYVEAEMVRGGYGTAAEPIYSNDGKLISPNKITLPKFQTTTSRFFIFAAPGESCEVTLFRGKKAEKHTVTVTAE